MPFTAEAFPCSLNIAAARRFGAFEAHLSRVSPCRFFRTGWAQACGSCCRAMGDTSKKNLPLLRAVKEGKTSAITSLLE
ncbi:MAG: hypothetical protein ACPIOQ_78200, partial [Promethearchaeia archaeon]